MDFKFIFLTYVLLTSYKFSDCATNSSSEDLCVFTRKTGVSDEIFDFSELAAEDFHLVVEPSHEGAETRYYLSICHPLRNAPESCNGSNSGVCITTSKSNGSSTLEEAVVSNAGEISKKGFRYDNGWITYTYDSGKPCMNSAINGPKNYSVEINFLCATMFAPSSMQDSNEEPILLSNPKCQSIFGWNTKAACPKKIVQNEADMCIVKYSNSDETLNLHSLHSISYYNVSSKYLFNLCGPITKFDCGTPGTSVCDVSSSSNPQSLTTFDNMRLNLVDRELSLVYSEKKFKSIFKLICKKSAHKPEIDFVERTSDKIVFSVVTSAVCEPEIPNCVLNDKFGNIYDLRTLYKVDSSWDVIAKRSDHSERKEYSYFMLNICGPVHQRYDEIDCGGNSVGACEVGYSNTIAKNLGLITSDPVINKDGSITIIYTGGDQCGDTRFSRSTIITLYCSHVESFPTFVEKTETCQYIFTWNTPAACPRHVVTGQDCIVKDSRYGYVFDLNGLRNTTADYTATDGVHSYKLNVCGPLVSECNGNNGSDSLCQIKDKKENSLGKSPGDLKYNDGTIVMKFENGSGECDGANRSSQILFLCDHNGTKAPMFFSEQASCSYTFIWHTELACPPHMVIDCAVQTDDGLLYDLTDLSISFQNDEYLTRDNKRKFVMNVCRSVVHNKDSPCPFDAGACIIDKEHKKEPINIGKVENGPFVENGVLKLLYKNGDVCNGTQHYETLIVFNCDEASSFPHLITEENCKFVFTWFTPSACPRKITNNAVITTPTPEVEGNCTVKNPYTGYTYDLTPLMTDDYYHISHSSRTAMMYFNVCGQLTLCAGAGSCDYRNSSSHWVHTGEPNSNLHFHPGAVYLEYKNGDLCRDGVRWSTLLNFICPAEEAERKPVLIKTDEDTCTLNVNWATELACERRINCYVDTGDYFLDLNPLIKSDSNYEISHPKNESKKFYMNVCRPLNPMVGMNCRPGSAACMNDENDSKGPYSLGHPLLGPQYISDDGAVLLYTHGTPCPNKPPFKLSTRITFICDRNIEEGLPEFKEETDDCQYLFEWKTRFACPPETKMPSNGLQCQIYYDKAKANINLKPLFKAEGYQVHYDNKTYITNVCGTVTAPHCKASTGTCLDSGMSFGSAESSELIWDYDKLQLIYHNGDPCQWSLSRTRTTRIYFTCDMLAGYGHPVADPLMSDLECMAVFDWKTNVTCLDAIYADQSTTQTSTTPKTTHPPHMSPNYSPVTHSPSKSKDVPQDNSSHSTAVGITLLFFVTAIVVMIIVLYRSKRGHRLLTRMKSAFGSTGYSNIARRSENSSTLLLASSSRTYRVDGSDDDLLRV